MDELSLLMRQRNSPNAGAESLGALFGGGGELRRQQIFNQAASQGALMEDRLAQARQRQYDEAYKQSQRDARRKISSRYREQGRNDLADMFDAYDNPEQIAKSQVDLQKADFGHQAWDARNGDINELNRMLMVMKGDPVEFQRNLGEGVYTPNAYDTNSAPIASPVGKARINELGALAAEHGAQAARARAAMGSDKASNYRIEYTPQGAVRVNMLDPTDTQPVTMNGKPVEKGSGKPERFTQHDLVAALGGENGTPDPSRFRAFEDMKAKNPDLSDPALLSQFRNTYDDDPAAAASAKVGPPTDLAGDGGSMLSRLFGGGAQKPGRKVVRTGTDQKTGKRVVQYDDGSIEEQ